LFLEHKRAYRLLKEDWQEEDYTVPIGKADVKREGEDVTIITNGKCVDMGLKAADKLAVDGIEVHMLELSNVYHVDQESNINAATKTGKVLLVTEDNKEGSIIGEVSAIIAEHCLFDLDAPIKRLAAPDVPAMPYAQSLEKAFIMNKDKIQKAAHDLAKF